MRFAANRKVLVWVWRRTPEGAKVLLLRRAPPWPDDWHPVTGHVDEGEPLAAAAAREAREETACAGRVADLGYSHRFRATYKGMERQHEEHAFALEVESDACTLSEEHQAHRWATFDEAEALVVFEEQKAALRRLRRRVESEKLS